MGPVQPPSVRALIAWSSRLLMVSASTSWFLTNRIRLSASAAKARISLRRAGHRIVRPSAETPKVHFGRSPSLPNSLFHHSQSGNRFSSQPKSSAANSACLLYTSDAADDLTRLDL